MTKASDSSNEDSTDNLQQDHNALSTHRSHTTLKNLGDSIHDIVLLQAENCSPEKSATVGGEWKYVTPPDGGYSWLVLCFCILLQLSFGMVSSTTGMLLVEWIEEFEKGEGITSWISTANQSILFLIAPLAGFLVDKIGDRLTIMIGTVGTGVSLAASSMTSNFSVLFFTYGVLTGGFMTLIMIPTTVTTAKYFQKYKVLALTMSTCCYPLIFMVAPPVVTKLIQLHGWRFAIMCVASAMIQCTVFAALLLPQKLLKTTNSSDTFDSTSTNYGKLKRRTSSDTSVADKCQKSWIADNDSSSLIKFSSEPTSANEQKRNSNIKISTKKKSLIGSLSHHSVCHWRMAMLLASNFAWGWGGGAFYCLMSDHAKSRGVTEVEVSQVLMAVGAFGFGGRLATVILCKVNQNFNKGTGLLMAMSGHAGAFLGLAIAQNFQTFIIMSGIYSASYGVATALTTPAILEMHGDSHLAVVFGLEMLLYGVGSSISAPFSAYMVEVLGSYQFGYLFSAGVNLLGGLVYLPHIIAHCISKQRDGTAV